MGASPKRIDFLQVKKLVLGGTEIPQNVADEMAALDGLTATAAELNILDGATVTAAELNELDLSAVGAQMKIKKLSIDAAPDGTEQDTGWDLPDKAVVFDVFVDVTAAEATGTTKTLDVGTDGTGSNDPNGYLAGLDVSTTGVKKGTLASAGQTLGALLHVDESGSANEVPEPDVASGGESITYTASDTDWVEFRGDIYIRYMEIG